MVTLKEIAQHCGVSVTTVSNIVNNSPKKVRDETRKKVMEAIEELGYHPNYFAQGLRRQRTQTIVLSLRISRSLRRRRLSKAL